MCVDPATEIVNFAAACVAVDMISDLPHSDADKDAMIRDLAACGPVIQYPRSDTDPQH
jgi:hypothetical protein